MAIYGWIILILQAVIGTVLTCLLAGPAIIAKIKNFKYNIRKRCEDEQLDIDKRSEERKHRNEIRRQKDFELANKKLDIKLNKVNKKIEIQTKKLKLAEELRKQTEVEKSELNGSENSKFDRKKNKRRVIEEVVGDEQQEEHVTETSDIEE